MDEILKKLYEQGPEVALLAIILIKLFESQLAIFVPQAVKDYFAERAKLKADQQEHEQSIRQSKANLDRLKEMSQLSSLSFTEEQLTQMASETQTQLVEANTFIRQLVNDKLDIILEKQNRILEKLSLLLIELRKRKCQADSEDTQVIK